MNHRYYLVQSKNKNLSAKWNIDRKTKNHIIGVLVMVKFGFRNGANGCASHCDCTKNISYVWNIETFG